MTTYILMKNWFGLKCKLALCGGLPKSDDKGCWGECVNCGKIFGYTDRRILSSYSEVMEAHKKHNELVKSIKD